MFERMIYREVRVTWVACEGLRRMCRWLSGWGVVVKF